MYWLIFAVSAVSRYILLYIFYKKLKKIDMKYSNFALKIDIFDVFPDTVSDTDFSNPDTATQISDVILGIFKF